MGPRQTKLVEFLKTTDLPQTYIREVEIIDGKKCYCALGIAALCMPDPEEALTTAGVTYDYIRRYFALHAELLWRLNDQRKLTFAQIGETLENNPDEYFWKEI